MRALTNYTVVFILSFIQDINAVKATVVTATRLNVALDKYADNPNTLQFARIHNTVAHEYTHTLPFFILLYCTNIATPATTNVVILKEIASTSKESLAKVKVSIPDKSATYNRYVKFLKQIASSIQ